jgi:hypothetical protein
VATNSARAAESADLFNNAERLQELIVEFRGEAMNFVAQPKVTRPSGSGSGGRTSTPMIRTAVRSSRKP